MCRDAVASSFSALTITQARTQTEENVKVQNKNIKGLCTGNKCSATAQPFDQVSQMKKKKKDARIDTWL